MKIIIVLGFQVWTKALIKLKIICVISYTELGIGRYFFLLALSSFENTLF